VGGAHASLAASLVFDLSRIALYEANQRRFWRVIQVFSYKFHANAQPSQFI
jgi:hypothetical protein